VKNELRKKKKDEENEKEIKENKEKKKENFQKKKPQPQGCNQPLAWNLLPKLEDDVLLELFKVKSIEEIKSIFNNNNFEETQKKYENEIDKTFH